MKDDDTGIIANNIIDLLVMLKVEEFSIKLLKVVHNLSPELKLRVKRALLGCVISLSFNNDDEPDKFTPKMGDELTKNVLQLINTEMSKAIYK